MSSLGPEATISEAGVVDGRVVREAKGEKGVRGCWVGVRTPVEGRKFVGGLSMFARGQLVSP